MDIHNYPQLKALASQRLEQAKDPKRIVLIYGLIILGMTGLGTAVNLILSLRMDQGGGLGSMGQRSTLGAIQAILPIVESLVSMCLGVGYLAAMLRVARGQFASSNTLRLGFDRFWVLLRMTLLRTLLLMAIGTAASYAGAMLYVLSPLSRPVMDLLVPVMEDASILSTGLVIDEALYEQLIGVMWPAVLICMAAFCAAVIPAAYQYRMAEYVLIDKPALGAMAVLRESRRMMRRNRIALFLLDVKQFPYYLAILAATIIGYGDTITSILGIPLPISGEAAYLLFTAVYLGLLLLIYTQLRNRVETVYALAYDAIRPPEQPSGAVLGNIFQM